MAAPSLHPWVHPFSLAFVPGPSSPAIEQVRRVLFGWLERAGCTITTEPNNSTELIVTTNVFGRTVHRDDSLFFHAKRRYRLSQRPTILTIVDIPEAEYQSWVTHFEELVKLPEEAALTEQYAGLGPQAVEVIAAQARRGGPELAIGRLIQGQVLSIRVMALRTENGRPYRAMHFDLAGARPVSDATDLDAFAEDVGSRWLAAVCATEVNHHSFSEQALPGDIWTGLSGPDAMVRAGQLFTRYGFFTTPTEVEKILGYRGIGDAISAQYSEGCYGVFEPDIPGLLTTATGSSRLVDKRSITRTDQAIVVGLAPGGDGAIVRPVAGMEPVVPSVEAVEMMSICEAVPTHTRVNSRGEPVTVPNVRAILHGHLGVDAYNPTRVESVNLDPLYYTQLVSCGTGPLARGTAAAFARSQALSNRDDPRSLVFLEQPGHGVIVVEKWTEAGALRPAFDLIREALTEGHLQMSFDIPQGPFGWETTTSLDGQPMRRKVAEPVQVA